MGTVRVFLSPSQRGAIESLYESTKHRVTAKRCRIMLLSDEGYSANEIQERVGCVRSTVYTTIYRFEDEGVDGLHDKRLTPGPRKATAEVRCQLRRYVDGVPKDFGWQRSTWTLELFALQLEQDTGVSLSPSHLRQILRQEECRRGRPRQALRIPVRGRRHILAQIKALADASSAKEEVLYVDEADIDLNPRIGTTYIRKGSQPLVLTPGQNVKYYVAGALNSRTGKVVYSHGPRKNSELFVNLLDVLRRTYRSAKVIHLVLDNYIIHKSALAREALKKLDGKIQLHFLPPYSPEHNPIERLWKQLHDNVTRNHRHTTMQTLWHDVTRFLHDVQPFPGTKVSTKRAVA